MQGIQICSNKAPGPLQRGDNHKNVVGSFKNFLLHNHWVKGTLNCSNKGQGPLQRGDNKKKVQKWGGVIEKCSLEPLSQNWSYLHESFLI